MLERFSWKRFGVMLLASFALQTTGCMRGEYFPASDPGAAERLHDYLSAVMESRPMPGLSVAIVKGSDVIFAEGFGVRALGGSDPVTPATVFHTASVSKAFVATAAARLAVVGRLDLDAPVKRYLPYFRLEDAREGDVTVRHLLAHTSGLPDVEDYGWDEAEFDEAALERYVRSLGDQRLLFDPGAQFKYSNMAYEVLGDVLAKVEGMPFEDVIRMLVLQPIGMHQSSFLPIEPHDRAAPHRGALAPTLSEMYPYNRAHAPSSTLRSNALDLARFVGAMLHQGDRGEAVVSDAERQLMWHRHARVDRGIDVGLGWFLRSHRRSRMALMPGRDPGFNAVVAVLPDRDLGVVLLSNYDGQSSFELVELVDGILDVGLGRKPVLPRTSIAVPIARVFREHGLDSALTEYQRLRSANDGRYHFGMSDLITLGHDLRQTGRVHEATRFYQLNAQMYPDYFGSHSALATAYLQLADTTRAIESYRRVLAMTPERYGCPESCYRDDRLEALLANP